MTGYRDILYRDRNTNYSFYTLFTLVFLIIKKTSRPKISATYVKSYTHMSP